MDKTIQIHLRIRNASNSIWDVADNIASYTIHQRKISFDVFDSVFYKESTLGIYEKTVKNIVDKFKQNENATIFAYGQTGSGKTHTIMGDTEKGIVQLALEDILPDNLEISFVELFNEKIFDLFTKKELKMYSFEDKTIVSGMHSEEIETLSQVAFFVEKCLENRRSGKTSFNLNSSRSHAILQIKKKDTVLTFIDLAGSERACYDAKRMKEASFINRSLLALGTLVNNLLNNKSFGFRDSKLTRFLQDTLTRKTNLVAFCMIDSRKECLSESLSTLGFAARLANLEIKANETKIDEIKSKNTSVDFYKMSSTVNEEIIQIQRQRIEELERMVLTLLEDIENKPLSDAFVLEKQMYQIKLDSTITKANSK
ncbi:uncharacterized protein VICG_00043 [Vittaforma corneae ATCC 50505]|uniref:Kinesin motor domain-containing protein n=1 Tax=Vittaforma corneae (strain ATCC 50505) TaxID=993615 RepID=L2GPB4_VITCO|nr:uncharacterized protein VICG_00043 [Vittaforma corneae ATCC 50505]ELA42728.1 hypothetical protein VICG_00043 [Vittaforma corneae ATCC 50505]